MNKTEIPKTLRWTVEFDIPSDEVRMGFDFTVGQINDIIHTALSSAGVYKKVQSRVVKAPPAALIRQLQKEGI